MNPVRQILLSNSRNPGSVYLEHARTPVRNMMGESRRSIAFLPYAAVRFSYDMYESAVADAFPEFDVQSVHRSDSPRDVVAAADAIAVGGGNTFCLLDALYRHDLIRVVRDRVLDGVPYIGWSAGSNVACPSIRTTNDMPIVEPPSFEALGLVPFQINPHYLDAHPESHMGETRQERIEEFLAMRPDVFVLGLREGAFLERTGDAVSLEGTNGAMLFRSGASPEELSPGTDLSFLLKPPVR